MKFKREGNLYVPDYKREWIIPPSPERNPFRYQRYLDKFRKPQLGFTFVNSGSGGASGSSTTIATGSVTGVTAGDFVIVGVKWEANDTTVSVSDGGSTFVDAFSGAHIGFASGYWSTFVHTLSTSSTGSKTYTATFGAASTFRGIIVLVYTPSAAVSTDGSPYFKGTHGTSGSTCSSGNITTTGTDGRAFGFYGDFTGVNASSTTINGVANDRQVNGSGGDFSSLWTKSYTSGFTGQAQGTIANTGPDWVCLIAAYQIASGGGGSIVPVLMDQYRQRR